MAMLVYALCSLTSFVCALFLARGYTRTRSLLLLWSSVCFVGFTINNVILFVDLVMVPDMDFSMIRALAALLGLGFLLYGLIWDTVGG